MKYIEATRRTFMAKAAKGLISIPFLSSHSAGIEAQTPSEEQPKRKVGSTPTGASVHLNVRDFGALGDGKTKDTAAIQQGASGQGHG